MGLEELLVVPRGSCCPGRSFSNDRNCRPKRSRVSSSFTFLARWGTVLPLNSSLGGRRIPCLRHVDPELRPAPCPSAPGGLVRSSSSGIDFSRDVLRGHQRGPPAAGPGLAPEDVQVAGQQQRPVYDRHLVPRAISASGSRPGPAAGRPRDAWRGAATATGPVSMPAPSRRTSRRTCGTPPGILVPLQDVHVRLSCNASHFAFCSGHRPDSGSAPVGRRSATRWSAPVSSTSGSCRSFNRASTWASAAIGLPAATAAARDTRSTSVRCRRGQLLEQQLVDLLEILLPGEFRFGVVDRRGSRTAPENIAAAAGTRSSATSRCASLTGFLGGNRTCSGSRQTGGAGGRRWGTSHSSGPATWQDVRCEVPAGKTSLYNTFPPGRTQTLLSGRFSRPRIHG